MLRRALRGIAVGLGVVAGSGLLVGCTSFRAARLYVAGTRALDRGDPAQAIAELEKAARLAPDRSAIQNHLGLAYAAEGREDAALRAFQRAVDLDCSNQAALENLRAAERRREAERTASRRRAEIRGAPRAP